MSWELVFIVIVLIAAVSSFVIERVSTDLTAICAFCVVLLVSVATASDKLPGAYQMVGVFSNPAPVTIAAMFILSAALEKCGVIEWIAHIFGKLTQLPYAGLLTALILVVALMSAFINNTAVVVVLLPVVLSMARRMSVPASKLLIPLSYASIFGGCCTAIGTSTNLLVSGILLEHGQPPLAMFELAIIGVPLLIGGMAYMVLIGHRLLPARETLTSILSDAERQEYITEAYVKRNSNLVDKTLKEVGLLGAAGVRILEVIRNGISLDTPQDQLILHGGDRIILSCRPSGIVKARNVEGMQFVLDQGLDLEQIASHEGAIVEGFIGPKSTIVGKTIREVNFRQRYRMIILAVHRRGRNVRDKLGTLRLNFGDTLLLMGADESIEVLRSSDDVSLLDRPPVPAADMRAKKPIVIMVMLGVVLSVTLNFLPIVAAALIGVGILFATNCLKPKEGYEAIEWRILMLIYGMLGLGMAMDKSGFSKFIAENLVAGSSMLVSEEMRPIFMLVCLYFCTGVLTEILSNNATVVLMAPIAIGLGSTMGVDPRPFIIATCIASSASFSTPIGYQTNTYVYSIGGYKFSDFFKVGLPLNLVYFAVSVVVIPQVWKF